jgi:hypothetical protein
MGREQFMRCNIAAIFGSSSVSSPLAKSLYSASETGSPGVGHLSHFEVKIDVSPPIAPKATLSISEPGHFGVNSSGRVFGNGEAPYVWVCHRSLSICFNLTRLDLVASDSPPKMGRDHGLHLGLKSRELTIVVRGTRRATIFQSKKL